MESPEPIPPEIARARNEFMEKRFWQLIEVQTLTATMGWSYLMSVNGGGVVAVLGYLGAVEAARNQVWPYVVLAVFMIGLLLVGAGKALLAVRADRLLKGWSADDRSYRSGQLEWSDFIQRDQQRVDWQKSVPWRLAWSSLAAFVLGVILAAVNFFWCALR